jgi:hypothetical protein
VWGNEVLLVWKHGVHVWSGSCTLKYGLAIAQHNTSISPYSPTGQRHHLLHGSTTTWLLHTTYCLLQECKGRSDTSKKQPAPRAHSKKGCWYVSDNVTHRKTDLDRGMHLDKSHLISVGTRIHPGFTCGMHMCIGTALNQFLAFAKSRHCQRCYILEHLACFSAEELHRVHLGPASWIHAAYTTLEWKFGSL